MSVALGPAPLKWNAADASFTAMSNVERQEAWALSILCRMAKAQMSLLDEAVREATALLIKQGTSSATEGGGTIIKAHQNMLLEVAMGAVKAASASVQRLSAFCWHPYHFLEASVMTHVHLASCDENGSLWATQIVSARK
jgi:hypothetical protein